MPMRLIYQLLELLDRVTGHAAVGPEQEAAAGAG